MVKSKIVIGFRFYKVMNNLTKFESKEKLYVQLWTELCFALSL